MAFQPGQSGNPGGRPKEDPRLKEMARVHTEAALAVIVANLEDGNPQIRQRAAEAILDRGYGKPAQSLTGADGGAIQLEQIIRRIVDPAN